MSKINHQNIEQWLFDFSEGNLNASQIRELNNFVQVHPEYQLDLDAWKNSKLVDKTEPSYVYTDQLLAISNTGYAKKYLVAAGLFFLLGGSTLAYFLIDNSTEEQNIATNNSTKENSNSNFFSNEFNKNSEQVYSNNSSNITLNNQTNGTVNEVISDNNNVVNHTTLNNSIVPTTNTNSTITNQVNHSNNRTFISNTSVNNTTINNTTNSVNPVTNSVVQNPELIPVLIENTPVLVLEEELIPSKLFRQEPVISTDKAGELMAKKAYENVTVVPHLIPDLDAEIEDNHVSDNKERKDHHKRKRFIDYALGFFNTRDHNLMLPGNMNIEQYAAFAGSSVSPALNLNYRNNQSFSDNASQSASFVFDQYSRKIKSAWGFGANRTVFGPGNYISNSASLYFSPKIKINKTFTIEPAFSASYHQNTVSPKMSESGSLIEPYKGYVAQTLPHPDLGGVRTLNGFDMSISTLVNTKYFYAVAGVDHLVRPTQNFYTGESPTQSRTDMKIKATVGTDFRKFHESKWSLSPQLSYIHQGELNEVWLGAAVRYDKLMMGASVAQNGQFFTTVGINAGILKINYNFDFTRSYLSSKYFGSHEVTLRLALSGISKKKTTILDQEK